MRRFKTVGLMGRQRKEDISDTLLALKQFLQSRKIAVIVEHETANWFPIGGLATYPRDTLGKHCDLIIVVGGDGSLLNAARAATLQQTPLLGINRGRLGFLTDIHPQELTTKVAAVLDGHYIEEQRFLLSAEIKHEERWIARDIALNDMVLMPGDVAHMIEFSLNIDEQFVCSQRADGLITATPTGSTAYALSGGGPILHPGLDAIVLVPMFPHTLSSRPLVVPAKSAIKITIDQQNETCPCFSCDGQTRIPIPLGASIHIKKMEKKLSLIHPLDYNYFTTLREKLHWNTKL